LRLLIISALAVTLTGCAYFTPQQARQPSLTSRQVWTGPSEQRTINIAGTLNTHTKNAKSNIVPASLSTQPDVKLNPKPNLVTKTEPPQSAQPDDKSNVVINPKPNLVTKAEPPQSAQPNGKSNENTKPNIVTRAEPPQSAQPNDKSNENTKPNIVTRAEPPQSAQPNDKSDPVITKAMATIAAKMGLENSASVELSKTKRAKKNALGKFIDTICGFVRGKNKSGADTGGRAFLYLVQEDEAYIEGYNLATSPYRNLCTQTASGLLEFLL
jgi:hypothetical protein